MSTQMDLAFPRLDESQIASIAETAERRHFADGEELFSAGGRLDWFFIVLTGSVEIIDASGCDPRTIVVHAPGEFTGDINIVTGRPPIVNGIARGATEVLLISSEEIRHIIRERPAIGDILLRAFIARRELLLESGFQGLRIVGCGDSQETYTLRDFMARNNVPFTWTDIDEDPVIAGFLQHIGIGDADLPVVMYGDQPVLRNPSIRDVAVTIGLRQPLGDKVYDLVVVGAGPAGLAAAVYASSEGLETLLLDSRAPGGQAATSMRIENYLGFPTGITGAELTSRAMLQAQKFGAQFSTPSEVTALDLEGEHPVIRLEGGESVTTRSLIIATGADYRKLDIPDRERFEGLGVYYAATRTELESCRGCEVMVVGGGNSAGQALMFLAEHTPRIYLLLRGDDLRASMSSYLADRIEATANIEVLPHTRVRSLQGTARLEAVEVECLKSGTVCSMSTPALFTFIGAVPRTAWLAGQISTDVHGFINTGRPVAASPQWPLKREPYLLETCRPGIFAVGDVRSGSTKRVTSAVGDGATAIRFVHEFLGELE